MNRVLYLTQLNFFAINYSNCIRHELTASDHLNDLPFIFTLPTTSYNVIRFMSRTKMDESMLVARKFENTSTVTVTNGKTKQNKRNNKRYFRLW